MPPGSGPPVSDRWRPGGTARSAIRTLVSSLQGIVDLAIYVAIVFLPILLILAIPFLLLRRFRNRRPRKNLPAVETDSESSSDPA